ncbi:MAG: hypothetical protein ACI9J3_002520 [Parvicellaceae bacterium]|jgi:hypothetical protein
MIGTWALKSIIKPGANTQELIICKDTIVLNEQGSFKWKCTSMPSGTWEIAGPSSFVEKMLYGELILKMSGKEDEEDINMWLKVLSLDKNSFTLEGKLAIPHSGHNNPIHKTYTRVK